MPFSRLLYPPLHGCLRESRPQHLAMGLALGVGLGGFPFGTPQWWIVLTLCFVLRAQPLLVLVGSGLSGLAVFCFPHFFHWLGWRLLIPVPNLHRLWAWAYHLPFVPFTHFNETVSFGRTIVTLIAGPLVYFLTLRGTARWEKPLQAWVQDTMGALHWRAEHSTLPPEPSVPVGWVRPHATWIAGSLAVLGLGWYLVAFEPWFKGHLETSASRLNAAPVKIRSLDFDLIHRRLVLRGVEITHPSSPNTNRFELDEIVVEFMATPLLYRKFVIKNIYTTGLHSNTHRSRWEQDVTDTTGDPSSLIDRVAAGIFRGMRKKTSPLNTLSQLKSGLNLQQTVTGADLGTIQNLENFAREWENTEARWTSVLRELPDENWFANLDWVEQKRSPATERLKKISVQKARVQEVRQEIETKHRSLVTALNKAAQPTPSDLRHMRRLLQIPDLSQPDLTWDVFGSEVLSHLERMAYWVDTSRRFMPPAFEQTKIPISIHDSPQGQRIQFHQGGGFATFLLINGKLSSAGNGPNSVVAKGSVTGITTNPPGWALPARIQLDASFPRDLEHLKLDAVVDHTSTSPRESIRLDFSGVRVENLSLNRGRDLKFVLHSPDVSGYLVAAFSEDSLNVEWDVRFAQSRFEVSSPYPELAQTLTRAVKPVFDFNMKGRLEGPLDRLHVEAQSELGRAVALGLRQQYRHALGAVDDNIRRTISERIRPQQEDLASRLDAAYKTAKRQLDEISRQLSQL